MKYVLLLIPVLLQAQHTANCHAQKFKEWVLTAVAEGFCIQSNSYASMTQFVNTPNITYCYTINALFSITNTYLLTPWYRVLLEKLTGLQLVKKFPCISRNPKVHYRTHKRPPPVSILGQPNPVHIPTSHLLEIHPDIIHPSMPRSPRWSLSLQFPHQDPIRPPLLTHMRHMPCPSHSSRFYHLHNIGWGVQIT